MDPLAGPDRNFPFWFLCILWCPPLIFIPPIAMVGLFRAQPTVLYHSPSIIFHSTLPHLQPLSGATLPRIVSMACTL